MQSIHPCSICRSSICGGWTTHQGNSSCSWRQWRGGFKLEGKLYFQSEINIKIEKHDKQSEYYADLGNLATFNVEVKIESNLSKRKTSSPEDLATCIENTTKDNEGDKKVQISKLWFVREGGFTLVISVIIMLEGSGLQGWPKRTSGQAQGI